VIIETILLPEGFYTHFSKIKKNLKYQKHHLKQLSK